MTYKGKKYYFDGIHLYLRPKEQISSILEIEGLNNFSQTLISLNLSKNHIKKVEGLESLTKMTHLNLSYNQISKLENLSNLSSLVTLDLSHNQIKKIEGLDQNKSLQNVELKANRIDRIENLENIPNLKILNLKENNLTSLQGIENVLHLVLLNVKGNQLKKVEDLETLINLLGFSWRKNLLLHNNVRPISNSGPKWTKFCQFEAGPSIIQKLRNLMPYANKPKKLQKRINFLEDYFQNHEKIAERNLKKIHPKIGIRLRYVLNRVRKYIRNDLETPWKIILFILFIFFILYPLILDVSFSFDPNVSYRWSVVFIIQIIIFCSMLFLVIIIYIKRLKKDYRKDLLEGVIQNHSE
ncbi:MAG: leucine-rich repeat domain-containing protein [Candidatus Lokiarchaeota archaeon]